MDKFDPRDLHAVSAIAGGRPGSACPDEQTLTAALDGDFRAADRKTFEGHVSACDYCLARLGQIARLKRGLENTEISDLTMARAQRLIRSRPRARRAPAWAAAAMIGFVTILATLWYAQSPENSDPGTSPVPEVRNIDPDTYRPRVVFPTEGESLDRGDPRFEWSTVPGTLHYDVRIVSADGSMIWQERVETPEWFLPDHLRLAAGEEYYFRVDAYITQAKSLSSRHVMFRVGKDE